MNYGEAVYFPYFEYSYIYNGKSYNSTNVCLDFESCYKTEWTKEQSLDNNGMEFAKNIADKIVNKKEAYIPRLIPSVSYLSIELSKNRRNYFLFLLIISMVILTAGLLIL